MTDILAQLTISAMVLAAFAGVLVLVLIVGIPPGVAEVANVALGTLGTMAASVVNYWLGSSRGSARKTDLLASSIPIDQAQPHP